MTTGTWGETWVQRGAGAKPLQSNAQWRRQCPPRQQDFAIAIARPLQGAGHLLARPPGVPFVFRRRHLFLGPSCMSARALEALRNFYAMVPNPLWDPVEFLDFLNVFNIWFGDYLRIDS
jgi:hypothetical protein